MKTNVKVLLTIFGFSFAALAGYSQNFKAIPDTVYLVPGIQDTVDLMANDIIPAGDSIQIQAVNVSPVTRQIISPEKKLVAFLVKWQLLTNGVIQGNYLLCRANTTDTSSATITCIFRDESYDSLNLNNINARFLATGCHLPKDNTCFEVPKGSGKGTIYVHSVWIGGKDETDQLHLAAHRFRQGPSIRPTLRYSDFSAGPVMDSTSYSIYTDTLWNYIWKISKSEIDYHKANYNKPGYQPVHDILYWPAHGNVAAGQDFYLAPFFDVNGDGNYVLNDGDFPLIRGDQALYFIFNDDQYTHSATGGAKLKAEIHVMSYAFDIPGSTAFDNTVFMHYRIINRSSNTYTNTFFGLFTDLDIGYAYDDYIGCDVERGMFFGYNGTPVDWPGCSGAYGEDPPAQAVVFLGGPLLNPDERDNPRYVPGNCEIMNTGYPVDPYAINGAGFGDSVVDNERMGMTRFIRFNYFWPMYFMSDPSNANEYYMYMQGYWIDSTKMIYGGNGHPSAGGYGPECNYIYPALSDNCNWGTNGQAPNGQKLWTEETANNNPHDRRGMGCTGPFTMDPGEEVEFDLAYVFARDTTAQDTTHSLILLGQLVDSIRQAYLTNRLPNGTQFLSISAKPDPQSWNVNIYPNPASYSLTVTTGTDQRGIASARILDTRGTQVKSWVVPKGISSFSLDVSGLSAGIYFLVVRSEEMSVTKKLVIIR